MVTNPKLVLLQVLRRARLLRLADTVRFHTKSLSHAGRNREFRGAHPGVQFPPLALTFDAYGSLDDRFYYESGRSAAQYIAELVQRHLGRSAVTLLDWGCGPVRVTRHFSEFLEGADVYGSDYNAKSIAWAQANVPEVKVVTNRLEPPLPFPDQSFDCIVSVSVFTHLSEAMHYAWRDELRRLLKPGGIVIFTANGKVGPGVLLPDELERFNHGELVVRGTFQEGKKWFLAYHSPDFMRGTLLKDWRVLEHLPGAFPYNSQDVWVVSPGSE